MRFSGKIVHVVIDDKFIDSAIRLFEAAEKGEHHYLMVDVKPPYVYVKDKRVRGVDINEFERELLEPGIQAVIFHSLPPWHYPLVRLIPDGKKIIWIGWGYDYIDLLKHSYPEGYVLRESASMVRPTLANRLLHSINSYVGDGLNMLRGMSRADTLARVDYFSPVLEAEYVMTRRNNSWFRADYIGWNYCTVEDDLTIQSNKSEALGNNLLVGNSATATNNHIELFRLIRKKIDFQSRKVIVPLSYGESDYRVKVLQHGREILGESFTPLIDFMPAEAYIETLRSCGFVYMNHIRQQALGNICISSLLGAKSYLNQRSPLYTWLKQIGMHIGCVTDLDDVPLSPDEQIQNRKVIQAHWGRSNQIQRTRGMIEIALERR